MEFIKRNMPIFVIGLVTLGIFLAIIITSAKNPANNGPELVKISDATLIAPHSYVLGDVNAPVTIVEFSDFECPACKYYQPYIRTIEEKYSPYVRVVYRNFPLSQHPYARKAAQAAQAAGAQGKFWEYADTLFANNENLKDADLEKYAQEVGLDVNKFKEDLNNSTYADQVNLDIKTATTLKLNQTPSFFLNGELLKSPAPEEIEGLVSKELEKLNLNSETSSTSPTNNTEATMMKPATVSFNGSVFSPKNITAKLNDTISIANKGNANLVLEDTEGTYFKTDAPKIVKPGDIFELKLTKRGQWIYKDNQSNSAGSIDVI